MLSNVKQQGKLKTVLDGELKRLKCKKKLNIATLKFTLDDSLFFFLNLILTRKGTVQTTSVAIELIRTVTFYFKSKKQKKISYSLMLQKLFTNINFLVIMKNAEILNISSPIFSSNSTLIMIFSFKIKHFICLR